MTITVKTTEAQEGFYPTPYKLAMDLVSGIDWDKVQDVLEPSAGKGNLVDAIAESCYTKKMYSDRTISIDCIEIDPYLRTAITDSFGDAAYEAINARIKQIEDSREFDKEKYEYKPLPESKKMELSVLEHLRRKHRAVDVRIVHDDFRTFNSPKHYDLIVMNPPFSEGDAHLLKAIAMTERWGGQIRCILNAETLRNPYTNRRQMLVQKLKTLGAGIEYREGEFLAAERSTDVEIAIVKLDIPAPDFGSDPESLYNKLKASAMSEEEADPDATELTISDKLQQIVSMFKFECDAGLRLIREYKAMQPYILDSFDPGNKYKDPILSLTVGKDSSYSRNSLSVNNFLRAVRRKYWREFFRREEFVGKLTSNLQEKYRDMVSELTNYDFSLFNLQKVLAEMNAEMSQGVIDTILGLAETLTVKHSWYPECDGNIHYFNGWATNKAHMINKKVIVPVHGIFDVYSWQQEAFRTNTAYSFLSDIEKALNYLDGNMTSEVNLAHILDSAARNRQTKNIQCKFFDVTFYKKGTVHIKFTCPELIDRFNIFCARQRGWLPPNYGRTKYADMTPEEKAVVDSFHGDNTAGSGEKAYDAVVARSDYFLAPPNHERISLMPAQE